MRSIDDLHCVDEKYLKEKKSLDELDISNGNRNLIRRFIMSCTQEGLTKTTVTNHMKTIRYMLRYLDEIGYSGDIDKIDELTFHDLMVHLEDRQGMAHNCIKTFKKMYRYLYDDGIPKWVQKTKVRSHVTPVQPTDILTR